MNSIRKIKPSIRLIVSLSIFISTILYIYANKSDPIFILYTAIILTAANVLLIAPKMLTATLITLVQTAFLASMVYVLQTAINPSYSILFTILAVLLSVGIAVFVNHYGLGRLWVNLTVIFVVLDIFLSMAYFATMSNKTDIQVLYIILAFIIPATFMFAKNKMISKKQIRHTVHTTGSNNILHAQISKLLKVNNIKSKTKTGFITRYIQAGEKLLFLYEPAQLGKTQITENGLLFEGRDYSQYLEEFIKQSVTVAKEIKINKVKIMPIVILHDYKDTKILDVKVYSTLKPDTSIGSVYLCSPNGLVKLVKSLEAKATVKQAQTTQQKYELI